MCYLCWTLNCHTVFTLRLGHWASTYYTQNLSQQTQCCALTQSLPCPRGLSVYSYSIVTKNIFSETKKKQKVHFPLTNVNKKIIFTSTAEFGTKIPHTLKGTCLLQHFQLGLFISWGSVFLSKAGRTYSITAKTSSLSNTLGCCQADTDL